MTRKIWVATTTFRGSDGTTVEANIEAARHLLDAASAKRPDVICLPETFTAHSVRYEHALEVAEPVPGPTTDMAAEIARRNSVYIVCPLLENRDGRVYNSAVIIDRRGHILGIYEKIHPVTTTADYTELEHGVIPGSAVKVFETDFGRVGVLICFDINWPGEWLELKRRGAEIVFWPSAYDGGFPLQVYAYIHSYYVVSATPGIARIIDKTGEVLARTGRAIPISNAQIDLEKQLLHTDFNAAQMESLRSLYGRDVTVRHTHDEALITIESSRDGLAVHKIIEEAKLERLGDYVARNERLQDALRQGKTPTPQRPPYLDSQ